MFFGGMPPGFDGMPGGPGMGRAPREPANTTELYEFLEVEKTATAAQIKKQYRKLALQKHPDKGGDPEEFKKIQAAYEVLKDPEKREKYDKFGLQGLEDEMGGGEDDLFSAFFGGGRRGSSRAQGPRKGSDLRSPHRVSLEDLYKGKTSKIAVKRTKLIGTPVMCQACNGQGVVIRLRQMGPMIQQIQQKCSTCNGTGYINTQKETERVVLDVHVEPGMQTGEKIKFRGMADDTPNCEPGDVVLVVEQTEHPVFKRKGRDLLISKTVSLSQALCGFEFLLEHLDKRQLLIKSHPGEIVLPETANGEPYVKCIEDEGMPRRGSPFEKGRLYIRFRVQFPSPGELDAAAITALRAALPPAPATPEYDPETVEEVTSEPVNLREFGSTAAGGGNDAYDSDEEAGGDRNVQCQQA